MYEIIKRNKLFVTRIYDADGHLVERSSDWDITANVLTAAGKLVTARGRLSDFQRLAAENKI